MIQNKGVLIGITGGIATGKSTVTKMLIEKGYSVIDADKISRQVVEIGKPAYNDIIEAFGLRILMTDKTINRKKLGRIIFESDHLRIILNKIIHPRVFDEIRRQVNELSKKEEIIFLDIPLLFEVIEYVNIYGLELKEIWMVYTNKETQLKRLMERDNINIYEATIRINSQMDVEEKRKRASKILHNDGNLEELEKNIDLVLEGLMA